MKLGSFGSGDRATEFRAGLFVDGGVIDIAAARPDLSSSLLQILQSGEGAIETVRQIAREADEGALPAGAFLESSGIRYGAPIRPGKMICVGGNYEDYRRILNLPELPVPAFFLKSPDCVVAHDDNVEIPEGYGVFYQEWELSCVIGQKCRHVSEDEAEKAIFGYTIVNDITGHTLENLGPRPYHMLGKNMETFAPVGPWILAKEALPKSVYDLQARRWRNGELVCESSTREMRRSFAEIISYVSNFMTLYPGDIVTGASPPAGPIEAGDEIEVEFEGVGRLRNQVVRADIDPSYGRLIGIEQT
ncbi:fumarylacetoacetate hydrolase family protein [Amorphus sp. 3PC139-8]|uniref:fumarylacetoacetate hydrolase family protein n=1 Tax=Amorphus sp. 3PC139-8 TaxID=2735676 RepID=UPI00345D7EA4